MSALPKPTWTPQNYLEYERSSDQRHEYLNGQIFALAGASAKHNLIVGNAYASLHSQLRKRSCVVYPSDMRLKITQTGLYTYPDVSVVCGTPQYEDDQDDILLNPTVIIEVLSPSTESYDRGKKFQHYRTIESLREYLLIAQDSYRVEHYVRQENDQWLLTDFNQAESTIGLQSINCKLQIVELYEKVTFDDQ